VRSAATHASVDVLDLAAWSQLFEQLDGRLAETMAGETTGVMVVVSTTALCGVAVGDSSAWLVTDSGIDDLTAGQRRARLGSGRAAPFLFQRNRLAGKLVVASDGLFKYASSERIAAAVRSSPPSKVAEGLLALAQLRGGGYHDDVAVVVVALNS